MIYLCPPPWPVRGEARGKRTSITRSCPARPWVVGGSTALTPRLGSRAIPMDIGGAELDVEAVDLV